MRRRPSARLLIVDPGSRVLLFRFSHHADALAGKSYWATPGGGLEAGESFTDAAIRELAEETGIVRRRVGACVACRQFAMLLPSGEEVMADERFFIVEVTQSEIDTGGWSQHEKSVISGYRWWPVAELAATNETVFPADIPELLAR